MKQSQIVLPVVVLCAGCPPVKKDVTAPGWPAHAVLRATSVTRTSATLSWPTAEDPGQPLRYRLYRDDTFLLDTDQRSADITGLVLGEDHTYKVEARDAAGNWTHDGPAVHVAGSAPAPRAPALDRTVPTTLCDATAFLYTGADAIQHGVTPGGLHCDAAALLRGRVLSDAGDGLGGVRVSLPGRPQWGFTFSQGDGQFDLVVEAGQHTVEFTRTDLLPAHRVVTLAPQQWGHAPDVVLKRVDPAVSAVTLQQGGMHSSTPQTDKDGTRKISLYFPPGTQASLQLPGGATQEVATAHVRATEYTVGARGPEAMPASLPPTSNYGFAAELSLDEAIAAGAQGVAFSQPVTIFVDNFRELPVGAVVPMGYYDRAKQRWVPEHDARVVALVSVTEGKADFDSDGDGKADTLAGVTDAERVEAARTFAVGARLWRGTVRHFTGIDLNFDERCTPSCTPPQLSMLDNPPVCEACRTGGSDIDVHNLTLGENFDVTGTPFLLRYQSDRNVSPGKGAAFKLDIPWVGGDKPLGAAVFAAELQIEVAGKQWTMKHDTRPASDEVASFVWDGKDAYGRTPQGPMDVSVTLSYRNHAEPGRPVQEDFNFLDAGGNEGLSVKPDRSSVVLSRTWKGHLGGSYSDAAGVGGLSLSVLHQYVPGRLYRGDGTLVQADALGPTLEMRVGGGTLSGAAAEDVPGTQIRIFLPTRLAAGPDGTLYVNDGGTTVRRVAPDGTVRTIAGGGGLDGDGIPAVQAHLNDINGIAADRHGNVFIADAGHRIYRVDTSGIIRPVAGTGERGYSGDGGDARKAKLYAPTGLVVTPDGDLYFLSYNAHSDQVLRRVRDGIISTVAGGGTQTDVTADGVEGLKARLRTGGESHLVLGSDGSIYFSEQLQPMVRRLAPDGRIYRVAGSGVSGFSGDGGAALEAALAWPTGIAVWDDGTVDISDTKNQRVRRVRSDGRIETLAGTGSKGNGGAPPPDLAARATLLDPYGLALLPGGTLALAERTAARVRVVTSPHAAAAGGHTQILPSSDGAELYVFTDGGRHLKTLDALTKALRYEFRYSARGTLDAIVDGSGNTTVVMRDPAGRPQGIRSPDGLVTALTLDGDGRVTSIVNPNREATRLSYGPDGLLASLTDARGNTSTFQFDGSGQLLKDTSAAGGSKRLDYSPPGIFGVAGNVQPTPASTTVTTAEGRTTVYVEARGEAFETRNNTFDDGTGSTFTRRSDGSTESRFSDQTVVRGQLVPDPRFGMAAPVSASIETRTPSGLQRTVTRARTVTLADPTDILSDTAIEDVTTVNGKTWKRSWDGATRTLTTTTPLGRQASVRFDARGQWVESKTPGVLPIAASYDARGRPLQITQGTRISKVGWGSGAFPETLTDALSRASRFEYDAIGRPTRVTRPDGKSVQLQYDALGNLTQLTPPDRPAHSFTYTPRSLLDTYRPPELPGVGSERHGYDLDDKITASFHPDGGSSQYFRDDGGRLTKLKTPWGDYDFNYGMTSGLVKNVTHAGETLAWNYDGFLTTSETASGLVAGSVEYAYDSDFRVTSLAVNGTPVTYSYDDDGLLIRAGALSLTRSPATGQLTRATLGAVTSTWSYDPYGAVETSTAQVAAAAIFQETVTRDALSRITEKTETVQGITTHWTYTYDAAGRLQQVTRDGTVSGTYAFDGNGNRVSADGVSAVFDSQDRLVSSGPLQFTYDAFGSLTQKRDTATGQATRYQYDGNSSLRRATLPDGTVLDYLVDARGRRIGKKRNGQLENGWLYDGQLRIVAELDGNGTVTSRFVYGTLGHSPDTMVRGGVTYRFVHDSLGSVRLVINAATGAIAQRIDYDEWGNVRADSASGFQPFGFAGGLHDGDLKLVRFGARDYDPVAGRWTSKDPIGFRGNDLNLYAYVSDRPIDLVDPAGLLGAPLLAPDAPRWTPVVIEGGKSLVRWSIWELMTPLAVAAALLYPSPIGDEGGGQSFDVPMASRGRPSPMCVSSSWPLTPEQQRCVQESKNFYLRAGKENAQREKEKSAKLHYCECMKIFDSAECEEALASLGWRTSLW